MVAAARTSYSVRDIYIPLSGRLAIAQLISCAKMDKKKCFVFYKGYGGVKPRELIVFFTLIELLKKPQIDSIMIQRNIFLFGFYT